MPPVGQIALWKHKGIYNKVQHGNTGTTNYKLVFTLTSIAMCWVFISLDRSDSKV
jgi:hypothetical protein